MKYYAYTLEDFRRLRPEWEFLSFPSLEAQNKFFAEDLIKRIQSKGKTEKTVVILPVGPIDYKYLIRASNEDGISLRNLVIFFMDEYCDEGSDYIEMSHPLSFRRFVYENFYKPLKPECHMPEEQIIFPNGKDPQETSSLIRSFGGIEVTYTGLGINGHLAFNEPPEREDEIREDDTRYSTVRRVSLSRETIIQNAIGGTGGNVEIIPRYAVTLGMKELLSAREVHLYLMRTWHSGIMRRALFGGVTPKCPGSYIQLHDNVRICMTPEVVNLPVINVTLNIGK